MKPSNVQELERWCDDNCFQMRENKEAMLKEFQQVDVHSLYDSGTGGKVEFTGDGFDAAEELFRLNPVLRGVRIEYFCPSAPCP